MFSNVFKSNPQGIRQYSAGASRASSRQQLEASLHSKAAQGHFASGTVVKTGAGFAGGLGTQSQHGLARKSEVPVVAHQPKVQTTARKNDIPVSGWAGDMGLRSRPK